MKQVYLHCSYNDKRTNLRDDLQPLHITDRVVKTSSFIAFGKILTWKTLGPQEAHRLLRLTDLYVGGIFNSLSSFI